MRCLMIAVLVLVLPGAVTVSAKTKKVPADLKPITMELQWNRVRYMSGDVKLNGYKPLREYIDRLGDAEASRLALKASKTQHTSNLFSAAGGIGVGWGLATLWWGHDKEWKDPEVSWPLFTGLALGLIGDVIRNAADSKKFDAVQRFNAVVRGEQKISLGMGVHRDIVLAGLTMRF